jgi:hypothetical protein
MKATARPGRFIPLLVNLSVLFVVYPFLAELGTLQFYWLLFGLVLISAVYSQSHKPRQLVVAAVLALPSLAGTVLVFVRPSTDSVLWANTASLLFLAYVTIVLLESVLRAKAVDRDTLAGAICVYLMLGLTWASAYGVIEGFSSGSFSAPEGTDLSNPKDHSFLYLSFVTLTTLGYGDFTPLTPIAQTATWMEGLVGQLYIAILIARLVTLYGREGK